VKEVANQGVLSKFSRMIQINAGKAYGHLGEVVVDSMVAETSTALLDAEPKRLCGSERYERTEVRHRTRERVPTSGTYRRKRVTSR